jgi:hypothetical protein
MQSVAIQSQENQFIVLNSWVRIGLVGKSGPFSVIINEDNDKMEN